MTPLYPQIESDSGIQRQKKKNPSGGITYKLPSLFTIYCTLSLVCSHRNLSVPISAIGLIPKLKTCHHSIQQLYIGALRIHTEFKYKSTVHRISLLFFTSIYNHNFFLRTSCSSSPIRFKPHPSFTAYEQLQYNRYLVYIAQNGVQ